MNSLQKTYQNLSDDELLKVLAESHKFNKEAILVAKEEFHKRALDPNQIELAKEKISLRSSKVSLFSKKKETQNIDSDFEKWNSEHTLEKKPQLQSQIIVIGVFSILISISNWFNNWYLLLNEWAFDLNHIFLIEPLVNMFLLPIAALLFLQKYTSGWVILTFIYLRALLHGVFYIAFMYEGDYSIYALISVGYCLVYGLVIWFLLDHKMKTTFSVNQTTSRFTAIFSLIFSFITLLLLATQH